MGRIFSQLELVQSEDGTGWSPTRQKGHFLLNGIAR